MEIAATAKGSSKTHKPQRRAEHPGANNRSGTRTPAYASAETHNEAGGSEVLRENPSLFRDKLLAVLSTESLTYDEVIA